MASGATITLENHETGEVKVWRVSELEAYQCLNIPVLNVLVEEES